LCSLKFVIGKTAKQQLRYDMSKINTFESLSIVNSHAIKKFKMFLVSDFIKLSLENGSC
jgi:hypothetical protein